MTPKPKPEATPTKKDFLKMIQDIAGDLLLGDGLDSASPSTPQVVFMESELFRIVFWNNSKDYSALDQYRLFFW